MTKQFLYTIYDSVAEIYNQPFYAMNDNVAMRIITEIVNDSETNLYKNPLDYILYGIGEYDPYTGVVETYSPHKNLGITQKWVVGAPQDE